MNPVQPKYLAPDLNAKQWCGVAFVLIRALMDNAKIKSLDIPAAVLDRILETGKHVAINETPFGIKIKSQD